MSLIALVAAVAMLGAPEPQKTVNVWVSKDVAPGKNIRLAITTRNLPEVHVTAFRVNGFEWLSRFHQPSDRPTPIGPAVKSWPVSVAQSGQRLSANDNYFQRQVNLPISTPGVYLLEVASGPYKDTAVVNVTNLAVVSKRSPTQCLVWVTDHKSGRLLPNVEVRYTDGRGETMKDSRTGPDGASLLSLPKEAQLVVLRRGRDIASVMCRSSNFDGVLNAFWQTDRPIYRPGQTVLFKTVLRRTHGQGYLPDRNRDVTAILRDPRETPLDQIRLRSNSNGSVAGQFTIPSEGMLGAYTVDLQVGNESTRKTITVAEYRKPEFKVDLAPAQKRYLSGDGARFKLHAAYYFGAALPQAAVRWVARRSPMPFYPSGPEDTWFYGGDGNLYPSDTYASEPFVAEGAVVTDNSGDAVIEINTDSRAPDSTYEVTATVIDQTNRQSVVSSSVPVYTSNIRLGISLEAQAVGLGDLIPLTLHSVDLDGGPARAVATLRVIRVVHDEKLDRDVEQVLTARKVQVPASGRIRTTLPSLAEGELILEATVPDGTGRVAKTRTSIWVMGLFQKPEKEEPEPMLDVKLDKRVYSPGDVVKAYVTDNTPNHPILLVAEGLDIWTYKVVRGRAVAFQFKTGKQMSPTAYLSASQWVNKSELTSSPMIPIPDRDKLLSLEIRPDKAEYRPGDKAVYRVTTRNRQGAPVPAEVCLSIVDEAIYALAGDTTADPYTQYWGHRQNYVQSFVSSPEEVSGGAYQRANPANPTVRQRFEDTAYWNAFVKTGADGEASVSFEVPGNLTTWRATARTITPDTLVGSGTSSVIATRPLTLRLALPRQMVSGDKLVVQGTVNNRTKDAASVKVSLAVEGGEISGDGAQVVSVPAKGQTVVQWLVTTPKVPDSGAAQITGEAIADSGGSDMGDALKVSLPIVPKGYRSESVTGGTIGRSADVEINLPEDALPEGTRLSARVYMGLSSTIAEDAKSISEDWRWGSPGAANELTAAAALGLEPASSSVREPLALLSRTMTGSGWGWWDGSPPDKIITAQVAHALALAKQSHFAPPEVIEQNAIRGCLDQFNQTQLWEHRALLGSSLYELNSGKFGSQIQEVIAHGQNISPFGRLRMAEAMAAKDPKSSEAQLGLVLPLVSRGDQSSYLPVGDGLGWSASPVASTAELLTVLIKLNGDAKLQEELARWLVSSDVGWLSSDDRAMRIRALALYRAGHPDSGPVGEAKLTLNGRDLVLKPSTVDPSASIDIDRAQLKPGKNVVHLERSGDGEALFEIHAVSYRPAEYESQHGIRVSRRFEVRNAAGVWQEVDRAIKPGEPVRVTAIVWGDDIADAVRVEEPTPAAFEFVDSERVGEARQEVRDGAVIEYLSNAGTPQIFRYYLRAEAGGWVTAPPASGQYLRRPRFSGHGNQQTFEIVGGRG
ncbi:MAG TPA: MG2 domain-containing protein [Fimbriimonas sp.]|nr:MG2 domain-containing protein [Fimbriimonas sp.]